MEITKRNINKKEVLLLLKQIALILVGTFVMSFGFMVFLSPHNIVPGGFMGIAQILYDVLSSIGWESNMFSSSCPLNILSKTVYSVISASFITESTNSVAST